MKRDVGRRMGLGLVAKNGYTYAVGDLEEEHKSVGGRRRRDVEERAALWGRGKTTRKHKTTDQDGYLLGEK